MNLRKLNTLSRHRTAVLIIAAFALITAAVWVLTEQTGWGLLAAGISLLIIEGLNANA